MFKIGKEYELGVFLGNAFCTNDRKTTDRSGPSEISTPVFDSFWEAIYFEKLLQNIYGDILYNYYIDKDSNEQKGNHFHYSLPKYFYEFYVFNTHFIKGEYNTLLTLNNRWRNTFKKWNKGAYVEVNKDNFYSYDSREYTFLTPNRQHKSDLTVEVRASEGSIVGDLCWLTIIAGKFDPSITYEYAEEVDNKIGKCVREEIIKKLCFDWVDNVKQRKEFELIQRKLLIPFVKNNFNKIELRNRGLYFAEFKLSKAKKKKVKNLLTKTILF